MAEICCDVASPREATAKVSQLSPRTTRSRRMKLRQFRFVGGAESMAIAKAASTSAAAAAAAATEPERKRQRVIEPSTPTTPDPSTSTGLSSSVPPADAVQITEISTATASVSNDDTRPKYGTTSVCGRRRDMEDAVSVRPEFFNQTNKYHFFGVFDGHGCSHVATSCRDRMHEMVAHELDRINGGGRGGGDQASWNEVMKNSFSRMDAEIDERRNNRLATASCRCVQLQAHNSDHVGSTAAVAVVNGDRIIVANCGDSRAVLCRRGVPVPLSTDHKPDRPDELRRIEAAGGRVIYWDGARVLGVLSMSRAIGDSYLKPFVISEPEITITERSDEDECLIIASDGLWDVVTNEMACNIARMCLRNGGRRRNGGDGSRSTSCGSGADRACSDAAMLLTKVALARQSADNISVVVVDLRRNSSS